jgi:hypothetical protein
MRVVATKTTYLYVVPEVPPQALAAVEPGADSSWSARPANGIRLLTSTRALDAVSVSSSVMPWSSSSLSLRSLSAPPRRLLNLRLQRRLPGE